MGEPGREQRKHPRARLFTLTQTLTPTSGQSGLGRMEDLSVGGLHILSGETLDPNTKVLVRFNLPGGHPVEAQGVVVHAHRGFYMGIQFLEIKKEDRKAIEAFVGQKSRAGSVSFTASP
ncbi:PilZ domain-containing protein [Acidobacteriia bacterium AH_259_A11_L15]|nr:PilZ domain-containing protein [Acidobacteriia bacterium AH_259_A11_L15]